MYQKTTWQKQTTTISTIVKHPNQNPAKPAASKPESNMLSTMLSSDAFEELYKATSADIINFSLSVKKLTATPSCEVAACRDVRNARISAWKLRKTKCLHWQVGLQNLTEMFWNLHMELSAVRTCWMFYIFLYRMSPSQEKRWEKHVSIWSITIHTSKYSLFLSWWFTNTTQGTSGAKPSGGKLAGR